MAVSFATSTSTVSTTTGTNTLASTMEMHMLGYHGPPPPLTPCEAVQGSTHGSHPKAGGGSGKWA